MSKVRTSAYRQTPTPEGLKAIENGTLDYFDTEMYANFNTEVLEEYLEEKNRGDGFGTTKWKWNQMLLGLGIGIIFAIINQYVGLKVGMIVSGSWYVAYLSAMALRSILMPLQKGRQRTMIRIQSFQLLARHTDLL